jgi:hypothetical protein
VNFVSNITRPAGDPKVIATGSSSLGASDRLARALGWSSFGLGLMELVAPRRLTRALGMEGQENLVRLYGAREIGAGMLTLSLGKEVGLWSRVAGDTLDIATLALALRADNPKRRNAGIALVMVIAVTVLDVLGAQAVPVRHSRKHNPVRSYSDRSGFPQGLEVARKIGREAGGVQHYGLRPT